MRERGYPLLRAAELKAKIGVVVKIVAGLPAEDVGH